MGRQTVISWNYKPFHWTGQDVVIVASGPSARSADLSLVKGRARTKVLAVNLSWRLVPWADAMYASDGLWWDGNCGCPEFMGRKFTSSPVAALRHKLDVVFTNGNNSGLRAIHLAKALGASRIMLVGFDMHNLDGNHWHEPHPKTLHNPTKDSIKNWVAEVTRAAALSLYGADVVNCTPGSALQCFSKRSLEEALNGNDAVGSGTDQQRNLIAT